MQHEQERQLLDNAVVESFFSTLKREMVSRENFETRKEARLAVFEWIEVFGTTGSGGIRRWATSLGYLVGLPQPRSL